MEKIIRKIHVAHAKGEDARQLLRQEWLVDQRSGRLCVGHDLRQRYLALSRSVDRGPARSVRSGRDVQSPGGVRAAPRWPPCPIGGEEPSQPEDQQIRGLYLTEFRLENQLPIWRYEIDGIILEKHLLLLHGQNTVHIGFRLLSKQDPVRLHLRPSMHFRGHERPVSETLQDDYILRAHGNPF